MIIDLNELKYSEILKRNKELRDVQEGSAYSVSVLSNIITSQLNDILEFQLRSQSINATVASGDYDNIVQDSHKFKDQNLVIIFWELANIVEGLPSKYHLLTPAEQNELVKKIQAEINFVFQHLKQTSLVIMNTFSSLIFSQHNLKTSQFEQLALTLNQYIQHNRPDNVLLVNIDKILARKSIQACVDMRYYYSSKALYSIEFYKEYTKTIQPIILSSLGKTKKALIFDCDNTLWKGILGEDGIEGIEMSFETPDGAIFREIQNLAVHLSRQGVLIGICSKNNPEDVEEVLKNHKDLILKNEHISVKKVNWDDKVTNLKSIAKELNIGLDSLVFVDDSPFEVQFVNGQLPEVSTILVPPKLYHYPETVRRCGNLFFKTSQSAEDLKRVQMYKDEAQRKSEQHRFNDMEEYLASLQLRMTIYKNDTQHLARMAQLTQKTNQFNLTTIRYTQADIERFVGDDNHLVYSFEVEDNFGKYGLVGLIIIRLDRTSQSAHIDTLLMSCRIIGRNIELRCMDFIFQDLASLGIEQISGRYIKTIKNSQVSNLYDKLGFSITDSGDTQKEYTIGINEYTPNKTNYIEVIHG